jgi:hypothetical protein
VSVQRLVLTFKPGELVIHALYRTQDGPNPGTVRRRREVSDLVHEGLQDALDALQDGTVEVVGTSGFTTREDILALPRSYEARAAAS